ncbi:hypothetical protein ACTNBZ_06855, partial [Pseudoflavonifractor sp. HCP28S3_F10]
GRPAGDRRAAGPLRRIGTHRRREAMVTAMAESNLVSLCFADPFAPIKVRDGLREIAARQGLSAVSELTGGVKPW